eukprot:XP_001709006.1 Hypothetical protein GL50803_38908 [Giardia lamblia ATCC 50803]
MVQPPVNQSLPRRVSKRYHNSRGRCREAVGKVCRHVHKTEDVHRF